jgi:PAS domain S-box-containing protein
VDRGGDVVYVNSRLCDMTGFPADALVGRNMRDIYAGEHGREIVQHAMDHFDEPREGEIWLPQSNGRPLPVLSSGRRLDGEPPLSDHRIVTFIDLSAQKRIEQRLSEQYEEISHLSDTILDQAIHLKHNAAQLEDRIRERTAQLHEANLEAIFMLAVACEAKDTDTGAHVRRLQRYAELVAREMPTIASEAEHIGYSAILHDVGKIIVPDFILQKPGKLTVDERNTMELHTVVGESILSKKPFFDVSRQIARHHHENWDGSGYPDRLSGDAIPLPARIVHVIDVFDALTSPRVYKAAWPPDQAMKEIRAKAASHIDPEVLNVVELLYAGEALRNVWETTK